VGCHRQQDEVLKRLARLQGASESEIIRRSIDRELEYAGPLMSTRDHHDAWEDILRSVEDRKKLGITRQPFHRNRQELYEDPD
jgi:hypothetical protein